MNRLFILLLFTLSGSCWSADQVVDVENKAYWICKSKKNVRTVRVHVDGKGICTTFYAKEGSEKSIGSGKNLESCLHFMENVKGNLEKSNWVCRDITATRITADSE